MDGVLFRNVDPNMNRCPDRHFATDRYLSYGPSEPSGVSTLPRAVTAVSANHTRAKTAFGSQAPTKAGKASCSAPARPIHMSTIAKAGAHCGKCRPSRHYPARHGQCEQRENQRGTGKSPPHVIAVRKHPRIPVNESGTAGRAKSLAQFAQ